MKSTHDEITFKYIDSVWYAFTHLARDYLTISISPLCDLSNIPTWESA